MKVEFHRHNLGQEEIESLSETLKSVFLTTGPKTEEFEKRLGQYLNAQNPPEIIGVSSCTMALHLSLMSLGISGFEVITTPLSFMATANAIQYAGAKPIFVDIEPDTGNIDAELIEQQITDRTKAIVPVHLYGHMCDMKKISELANRYGLYVIEDAAHCIEGAREGTGPAMAGNAACLSFHALKTMTSGDGGAIVTYRRELADKLRILRNLGIVRELKNTLGEVAYQDLDDLGLRCSMSDIAASLLIPQIKHLDERLFERIRIANLYYRLLGKYVEFPTVRPATLSARNMFNIWVDPAKRDLIVQRLRLKGVGCTVQYYPTIPMLQYYQKKYGYRSGMFPNAEKIASRTIALPFYPTLKEEEINYVAREVIEAINH